jgi:hypothetical protein
MPYDALEEPQRQVLLDYLGARLIACEAWRASLNFLLESPCISSHEHCQTLLHRNAALVEWGEVMTEIETLKSSMG